MCSDIQPPENSPQIKKNENCENTEPPKAENTYSKAFWRTLQLLIIACILGMVICCGAFIWNSVAFSHNTTQTLHAIANHATQMTQNPVATQNPAATQTPATTQAAPATQNQQDSDADKDEIESLVKHMENMITVQKSGMTNDLLSFVYGILSTVLVGLCASFVVKSRESAEKTRETASKAQESANKAKGYVEEAKKRVLAAKQNAENAEAHAHNAELKAKETTEAINQAQQASAKAEEHASNAAKKAEETSKAIDRAQQASAKAEEHATNAAKKAEETSKAIDQARQAAAKAEELQYQLRLVIIDNRIQNSLLALDKSDQVLANKEIAQIQKEVEQLFSDNAFIECKNVYGKAETNQVYEDLSTLKNAIAQFRRECENIDSEQERYSKIQSANNYEKWVSASIIRIEKSIR